MDRRAKVELFEQIRREYEHGGGAIRGIAKKWGFIGAWCVSLGLELNIPMMRWHSERSARLTS